MDKVGASCRTLLRPDTAAAAGPTTRKAPSPRVESSSSWLNVAMMVRLAREVSGGRLPCAAICTPISRPNSCPVAAAMQGRKQSRMSVGA